MNFKTLVSSVVAAFAVSSAHAQWAGGGSGMSIGVGGGYSKTTLPNGKSISTSNLNWGVGLGSSSYYGAGGYGMGYGGYGAIGWGGMGYYGAPVVMPYYGGGCAPVVVPYSPFTGVYGNPCYSPQIIAPAAYGPQMPICW